MLWLLQPQLLLHAPHLPPAQSGRSPEVPLPLPPTHALSPTAPRAQAHAQELGVVDVQLRLTPLEEVFLNVARKAELEAAQAGARFEGLGSRAAWRQQAVRLDRWRAGGRAGRLGATGC